jgi:CRISPR/Cas system CMR subunit Cmr6 (Cas7 group RAMP superfamily)
MIRDLQTIYDTQKSFYGKAKTITTLIDLDKQVIELKSYNTIVARITKDDAQTTYEYLGYYSRTTARHQKEFFKQYGLNDEQYKKLKTKQTLIINE